MLPPENFPAAAGFTKPSFGRDLIWNCAAFAVSGGCGLLMNLAILHYYSFSALGFFNLLLAIFLIVSQLFSLGLPQAVNKFIPQFRTSHSHCKELFSVAFFSGSFIAGLGSVLLWFLQEVPGSMLHHPLLQEQFDLLIPSLGLAAVNRLMLSLLNGYRWMRLFAVLGSLRYLLMLLNVLIFILAGVDEKFFGLIFSLPEFLLFLVLFPCIRKQLVSISITRFRKIFKLEFCYGIKSYFGILMASLQSKTDVVILAYFSGDKILGVYSLSAVVIDGFSQLFYVMRTMLNPVITRIHYERNAGLLDRFVRTSLRKLYKGFLMVGLVAAGSFPVLLWLAGMEHFFWTSLLIFYILLLSILISSGYLPFQYYFNQVGLALIQNKVLLYPFLLLLIMNLLLVPFWGAFGTAAAYLIFSVFQVWYIRREMDRHLKNRKIRKPGKGYRSRAH